MKLHLVAVGRKNPWWVREGFEHYRRRMPSGLELELIEIAHARAGNTDVQKLREGAALLDALPKRAWVVACDEHGVQLSSNELAANLLHWQEQGQTVAILIGGPDGLAPQCLERANLILSLSRLTLPHGLARVVVAEALYRAGSIIQGLPYHRA